MIRKGIHPHFRPTVWQMLCNSHSLSVQEQYTELLQNTSPSEKLIQRDLSKLLPHHPLFQGLQDRLQQPLYNILKAYSVLDRDVGYHQGSVFIAGLLLMQMPEEQAFGVFVRLMQDFRLREIYRTHMVELGCCTFQLEGLIQEQLPDLYSHFRTQAFKTSTFSSSWFLTLFLSCLPLTAANRVFDIFMCEGLDIVFRVGLAILQLTETELMKLDAEGMTQVITNSSYMTVYGFTPDVTGHTPSEKFHFWSSVINTDLLDELFMPFWSNFLFGRPVTPGKVHQCSICFFSISEK
uniref:Rab-GAP TBC domain-containing protein n=1 Tax=Astyanax mexicanus TaxID=7994 RepID=A0A8B9L1T6_ASTMX